MFLDITATHEDRGIIIDVVYRTAEQVFIPLTVGGGIQSLETIKQLLRAGADKVSINSAAVRDPDFIDRASDRFGNQCIVVAIDARRRQDPHGALVRQMDPVPVQGPARDLWRRQAQPLPLRSVAPASRDRLRLTSSKGGNLREDRQDAARS